LYGRYGVEKSAKRGLRLLEFAAKNGSIKAQVELGRYYSYTWSGYHDLSKSALYCAMAADSGDITASYNLAMIYLDGNDTPKDYIKIYSLFKQSEGKGMESAQGLFKTPIMTSLSINTSSKIMDIFIEVTNRSVDNLHYNIGSL
jgi:TPR repeat protein